MSDDEKEELKKANQSAQDAQKALLAAIHRRKQQAAGNISFRQMPANPAPIGPPMSTPELPIPDAGTKPVAGSEPTRPIRNPPQRVEPAKKAEPKKKKRKKGEPEPGPLGQLKEKFDALPPTTRTAILVGGIGIFLLLILQFMGGGGEQTTMTL